MVTMGAKMSTDPIRTRPADKRYVTSSARAGSPRLEICPNGRSQRIRLSAAIARSNRGATIRHCSVCEQQEINTPVIATILLGHNISFAIVTDAADVSAPPLSRRATADAAEAAQSPRR